MPNIKPSYEVRQANVLTESRFNFSAVQLDIYFYLLSMLRKNDEPSKEYEIHVTHIKELTGREWHYNQLKDSTKDLVGRVIEFYDNEGNFCQTALLASAKYMKGKGCIKVTVSSVLHPLLFELKEQYTSFELYCALAMSSKYAKRLYMICSEWKHNETTKKGDAISRMYTIDELRYMLELTDPTGKEPDQYKQWSEFKEKVLDVAKNQINQYSDITMLYNAKKLGRSYQMVQFFIKKGNSHQLLIDFKQEDLHLHVEEINRKVMLVEKYGLNENQAKTVVRRFDKAMVNDVLAAVDIAKKAGKVKSIAAYTVTSLTNKFGVPL